MRALARLLFICSILLVTSPPGFAQQASSKTYMKMMEIQELWEEERYDEAINELRDYSTRTAGKPYDHAVVHQYMAHTYVFMDRIDQARDVLEEALALDGLALQLQSELNLIYGQIVLGDEEYELARKAMEFWFTNTEDEKQATHLFSLGYANYMTTNLPRAETLLDQAIGAEAKPRDSWYRLYYQVLFDQRKFAQAEDVILGMLNRNPHNDDYWRILANHYLQLEDSQRALASIAIAYRQGFLKEASDLKRMIALYGLIEVPERAARLLQAHIADESIEGDADMLKRLGDLWLLSRERNEAKRVFEQAAKLAPDGRTYEMLGNIYFEDENWESAHDSFMKALEIGGLSDSGRIYLLAGISAERGGMKDRARAAFLEARKSDDLRKQADSLLKRLERS